MYSEYLSMDLAGQLNPDKFESEPNARFDFSTIYQHLPHFSFNFINFKGLICNPVVFTSIISK